MSLLQNSNAISGGNYQIANSLRFQSASSQYLSRTFAASNYQTWTWSAWVKLGNLTDGVLFSSGPTNLNRTTIGYISNQLIFETIGSGSALGRKYTTQVFRDPSAWYHIVIVMDILNATASDRMRIYINGYRVTAFSTSVDPGTGVAPFINYSYPHNLGRDVANANQYFDGYLSEVNFVDGQALTPSSFGTTDATSGQWVAAKYTGTYGTNGFYLPFSNGTSTTTLGADSSGNGNNWTLTNFTRSAGVSDCWMVDVPSGNGGASGTQPSSNYAVMNPLDKYSTSSTAAANLLWAAGSNGVWNSVAATIGVSSGKWYWEYTVNNTGTIDRMVGIYSLTDNLSSNLFPGQTSTSYGYYGVNGQKFNNNTGSAYGATFQTANDVIGVALDLDAGTLTFYKNNTSQGVAFSGLSGTFKPAVGATATGNYHILNFGQRSFAYTPPTGFKALCTANLPVATIKQGNKYMDATLYTGNSSTNVITNASGFKPDLVWVKSRSAASFNALDDSVRGAGKALFSNATNAETTYTDGLLSFNSNGFTLGASVVADSYNVSPRTYVGWQWQAGQGTTSSNTNGSITSTVSVNATAGFSVVTYTGTGSVATVGHGLGVAPAMLIIKSRNTVTDWGVYHQSLGATKNLILDQTAAAGTTPAYWNNTAPTSSVFTVNTAQDVNKSTGTYVAYCFSEIAGFSKFGSYIGNGSADGTFVFTGFIPKFLLVKSSSVAGSTWRVWDTTRSPYNVADDVLSPNESSAELANNSSLQFDILSNGFKARTSYVDTNQNAATYIYMAFAENPLAQSNAR